MLGEWMCSHNPMPIDYSQSRFPKPKRWKRQPPKDGRVVLSHAKWTALRKELWEREPHKCGICKFIIRSFDDMELDHIEPRGMGGSRRNDELSNLQMTHRWCNGEKGSRRECAVKS